MKITSRTATNRKASPKNTPPDGYSRVGVPSRNCPTNLGEALNAECIRIAVTTDLPEALNANAMTVARPTKMKKKTGTVALVHP